MALQARDLWDCRGTIGRRDYALWGLILFVAKYNLDRAIAAFFFQRSWFPWSYLLGVDGAAGANPSANNGPLFFSLLLVSLPFVTSGVMLTQRRLRDAGWPPSAVILFFIPFVNLVFFGLLCVEPTRAAARPAGEGHWKNLVPTMRPFVAATSGIAASVALGVALVAFGTLFLKTYGWGLFVGTPFMMGFFSALFYGSAEPRTLGQSIMVGILSVAIVAGLLVALAIEGLICILMAAPIGLFLAALGAAAAWLVQRDRRGRQQTGARLYATAWVVAPLLLAAESRAPAATPLFSATTRCEISAPPAVVWRHVVSFGELPPPHERVFEMGIAFPVRARLEGNGVGAVRYCEFSTGPFVEPITAWDENRRLAFDVRSQPHPMREWSPYSHLYPAHLEGFFRSRRGEFRLTALPGGRTLLEGTTWYEQAIWPQPYWKPWSDYLVHTIHRRVLEHIRTEAERDRA